MVNKSIKREDIAKEFRDIATNAENEQVENIEDELVTIAINDILKIVFNLANNGLFETEITKDTQFENLDYSLLKNYHINAIIQILKQYGFIVNEINDIALTFKGIHVCWL